MLFTSQTFIFNKLRYSFHPLFRIWLIGCIVIPCQPSCDSSQPSVSTETPVIDYRPPPPKPPARFEEKERSVFWRPKKKIPRYVSVYFDNGSDSKVQVKFDEQSMFEVAPSTRKTLRTNAAILRFDTQTAQGPWVHHEHPLTPKMTYVYNVNGLWDYVLERVQFREVVLPVGSNQPKHQHFEAAMFLMVGPHIDYVFKPFPKTIKTTKRYNQIVATPKERTRLAYSKKTPNSKRRFRPLDSEQWAGVVESPDRLVLQPKESITHQSTLYVDSMERKPLSFWVNGAEVGQISRRAYLTVILPPGEYTFEVRNRRKAVVDTLSTSFLKEKRYLWNPKGRARYQVEQALYGQPLIPTQTLGMRRPKRIKARKFFEITWDYVFQPFPKTAPVSLLGSSTFSRLTRRGRP